MALLAVSIVLLHGVVTRGPTKPVCEMTTPCSEPAAHVKLVFRRRGVDVAAVTDARGRYAVRLPRGTWTIRISPPQRIGRGVEPATVVVRTPRRVDFLVDTGIR